MHCICVEYRVRDSNSYFLMTKDPEPIPGNILRIVDLEIIPGSKPSKHRFLKSYQATYVLQKQILKSGNILSKNTGY